MCCNTENGFQRYSKSVCLYKATSLPGYKVPLCPHFILESKTLNLTFHKDSTTKNIKLPEFSSLIFEGTNVWNIP